MKRLLALFVLVAVGAISSQNLVSGTNQTIPLEKLARQALDAEPSIQQSAIADLRQQGSEGLEAIMALCDPLAPAQLARMVKPTTGERRKPIDDVIDQVAGQRDARYSRLYWHTELPLAQAEAKRQNKPILSLRLLGKLTEERSCANSRLFRTILYSNLEVSKYLRENYILHWESVRPVPQVTIDFGDGRMIKSTITGNSIHYVLDSQGRLIDGLPGLYAPSDFLTALQAAYPIAKKCSALNDLHARKVVRAYHLEQSDKIFAAWQKELPADVNIPSTPHELEGMMTEPLWEGIARNTQRFKFDPQSVQLIQAMQPRAEKARAVGIFIPVVPKTNMERPIFNQLLIRLMNSTAIDSVKNEYLLHRKLHDYLAGDNHSQRVPSVNQWVYSTLFMTPLSDPWMGFSPPDVFTGLENGGQVEQASSPDVSTVQSSE